VANGRRPELQALLAERGEASIADLAARFEVSEMTIRRDLEALEEEGAARRVRGGAIATVSRGYEPPFAKRATDDLAAKRAIAAAAAEHVRDGETAIIDVGTTNLELAKLLRGNRRGVTVVTPSLPVAMELANETNMRVVVTGGIVRAGEHSLVGAFAERPFAELNCDVLFLGVGGVDADLGFTEYNLEDARIKRSAIGAARRTVVLADQSKFGRVCLATIAPLEAADVLISDAPVVSPVAAAAREAQVDFVHVTSNRSEEL
jgi:DeoR/GlpR family transcriptional regulator of sugar metabolism